MSVHDGKSRAREADELALNILHLRATTDLGTVAIAQRVGRTRGSVLGIEKRIRDAGSAPCACQRPENKDGGMPAKWWAK